MTVIKINDLRASGVGTCRVARAWCRKHDVDFGRLRREGIPYEEVKHISDNASALERIRTAAQARELKESQDEQ